MGIRYSYSDFTTKGHGVIESGGNQHDDSAYTVDGEAAQGYKFVKTVTHVDQIAGSIKNMSPSRKRAFIESLRLNKVLFVGKTISVRLMGDGSINLYSRPVVRKANGSKKSSSTDHSSYKEIYDNLKRINEQTNPRRSR